MAKKITLWCIGLALTMITYNAYSQHPITTVADSIQYRLKIDTGSVSTYITKGYLRQSVNNNLFADSLFGDSSIWYLKKSADHYYIVNKSIGDTLRFGFVTADDTVATVTAAGVMDTFTIGGELNNSFELILDYSAVDTFYTFVVGEDDTVLLAKKDTAATSSPKTLFSLERIKTYPDTTLAWQLIVDTLANVNAWFQPMFLSADTSVRGDSLKAVTMHPDSLAMWIFKIDDVVNDTALFKIYNAQTDSLLAFQQPTSSDSLAYLNSAGALDSWRIPFYLENDTATMPFRPFVRNTSNVNYYLALKGGSLVLTSNPLEDNVLNFRLKSSDYKPFYLDTSVVDSTQIYRVKYISGSDTPKFGRFLGYNYFAHRDSTVDSVYAHIPDGQFVIDCNNRYQLVNRVWNTIKTDSVFPVLDGSNVVIPNYYANKITATRLIADTFEITPLNYDGIDTLKKVPTLGYKIISPAIYADSAFLLTYSADSLNGRHIGYTAEDSVVKLMTPSDSLGFLFSIATTLQTAGQGADAIAGISGLWWESYYIRANSYDTTLYLTTTNDTLALSESSPLHKFVLKEDTVRSKYSLLDIDAVASKNPNLLVDSLDKKLYLASKDTLVRHLFTLSTIPKATFPDPVDTIYTYLEFSDPVFNSQSGFYEMFYLHSNKLSWLSKNVYDYAQFRGEGESMETRAGSYNPYKDFRLWVDTARGPATSPRPDKQSYYIVYDVQDTLLKPDVKGWFLHVMDSVDTYYDTVRYNAKEYFVTTGGKKYNRANFVYARRDSGDGLLLDTIASTATARDSVGYAGKNANAINEYRFYLQESGVVRDAKMLYFLVTEPDLGGETGKMGYLSYIQRENDQALYFGPREDDAVCYIEFERSYSTATTGNEAIVILPPAKIVADDAKVLSITGGEGSVTVRNAMGERVEGYTILGRRIVSHTVTSDNETIPFPRGIAIVKAGAKALKVVVR